MNSIHDQIILAGVPKMFLPKHLYFGRSALQALKPIAKESKLVVASPRAWELNKARLEPYLGVYEVLLGPGGEPSQFDLEAFTNRLATTDVRYVIAFGGGSVMDLAKTAALYGDKLVYAIPTTWGTGSEASRYSVFTKGDVKEALVSEKLIPDTVILDPGFVESLPVFEAAVGTVDALSHALEGLVSRLSNPVVDALALQAIDWIFEYGERAVTQADSVARHMLQLAGFWSGVVQSSVSVGAVHALAHHFGPKLKVPHGAAIARFLIPVLALNLEKSSTIYEKLNLSRQINRSNILSRLKEFLVAVGLREYLDKVFKRTAELDLPKALSETRKDACYKTNPAVFTDEEMLALIKKHPIYD